uniref:WAP domain-containing protein n=1 Tax=Globodera pallida TaxID=36090 RepID=A0A183CSS4_GLOPA
MSCQVPKTAERPEERKQSREEGEEAIVHQQTQNTEKKPSSECPLAREGPIRCEGAASNECLDDTNCAGKELKCCS